MHLSPASSTDQRELSTMIGIRATSGSVATRLRKVVIARSPSSRSASMFTSRRLAPPRTCSSATSTAAWKSPDSTSRRKRAEPVMFVRSPIIVKLESGLSSNGSRPLKRVAGAPLRNRARRDALDRGHDLPDVLRRRAAAAADDVHEPVARELAEEAARVLRLLVVLAERVRQARRSDSTRPRSARSRRGPRRTAASRRRRASS